LSYSALVAVCPVQVRPGIVPLSFFKGDCLNDARFTFQARTLAPVCIPRHPFCVLRPPSDGPDVVTRLGVTLNSCCRSPPFPRRPVFVPGSMCTWQHSLLFSFVFDPSPTSLLTCGIHFRVHHSGAAPCEFPVSVMETFFLCCFPTVLFRLPCLPWVTPRFFSRG